MSLQKNRWRDGGICYVGAQSVYRICNLCSTFTTKCGASFGKKIFRLPQMRKIFLQILILPQMRKILKKTKNGSSGIRTRDLSFTVHHSTTTLSRFDWLLQSKLCVWKNSKYFFLSWRKVNKIFLGSIDARNLVNFGHPVTGNFVKNSQKRKKIFFILRNCGG